MFLRFGTVFFAILYFGNQAYGETVADPSCSESQLRRCTDNADPLLSNSDYIVPDNTVKVNQVCRLWTDFTKCIHNYTMKCWERGQRMEFDRTFKDPVSSMNNLCQNPAHRDEYLKYAPCVKKISTQADYCGNQYKFLIDLVSEKASMKQICCARAKFRNCILAQTPRACETAKGSTYTERRLNNMDSTTMAVSILDTSLTFINQRCTSASFNEADCPGIDPTEVRKSSKGPLVNSELDPSSDFQLGQGAKIPPGSKTQSATRAPTTTKRILAERPKTDKLSSSTSTLGGSSKPGHQSSNTQGNEDGGNKDSANTLSWKHSFFSAMLCIFFSRLL